MAAPLRRGDPRLPRSGRVLPDGRAGGLPSARRRSRHRFLRRVLQAAHRQDRNLGRVHFVCDGADQVHDEPAAELRRSRQGKGERRLIRMAPAREGTKSMMLRAILGAAVLAAAIAAPPAWSADKPGPALHASVIDGIAEALLQDGATAPQRSGFVMGAGPDASPKYYFENGGSVAGPISFSELTARLAAGTIRLDTVLWKEGM